MHEKQKRLCVKASVCERVVSKSVCVQTSLCDLWVPGHNLCCHQTWLAGQSLKMVGFH